jgi:hypothetical protein
MVVILNFNFVSLKQRVVNLCYVRFSLLYSDVIYYINCCNTVMPLKCDPARKIVNDSGFPRTPDRLHKFCGTRVQWLEVFKTITCTCGPYYLGGSTTTGIKAIIVRAIVVLHFKTSKRFGSNECNGLFWSKFLIIYLYSSYSSSVRFKDFWWNSILKFALCTKFIV